MYFIGAKATFQRLSCVFYLLPDLFLCQHLLNKTMSQKRCSPEESPSKLVFERATRPYTWPTSYNMVHKPIYKGFVTFLTRGWNSNVFPHTWPMWYNLVHQTIHLHALAPWPTLGRSGTIEWNSWYIPVVGLPVMSGAAWYINQW